MSIGHLRTNSRRDQPLALGKGGGIAARLVGEGRGLGEGVEVAQRECERDGLLHVNHHLLLRLVHIAVRPARGRAQSLN